MGALDASRVPAAVRQLAECCHAFGPEPPPGSGRERILTDRYCVYFAPMRSMTGVERVRVEEAELEQMVEEVRSLLRARGRSQAAWSVGPSSEPADLADRLAALGMTPYEDPPLEPHYHAMVLLEPPAGGSVTGVDAREARSEEEMVAAQHVVEQAFDLDAREQPVRVGTARLAWKQLRERPDYPYRTYVAVVDGEIVGTALAAIAEHAYQLTGGAVLPEARGRGVYRALLQARWRDAVARGTPALTVEAGRMSSPILERAGFVTLAELTMLCDRLAPAP